MKLFIYKTPFSDKNYMLVDQGIIKSVSQVLPTSLPSDIEIFDFNNDYVYPSFNDTHMHFIGYGTYLNRCQLEHTHSISDLQNKLTAYMRAHLPEQLIGRGWNQDEFDEQRLPSRHDLDLVSKNIPIILYRACGHMAVVNTAALETFGITSSTQVDGGEIDLEDGEPTGILRENALSLVQIPITLKDLKQDILRAQKKLNAYGITSVQTDDLIMVEQERHHDLIQLFQEMAEKRELTVRVYEQSQFFTAENLERQVNLGYQLNKGNDLFRMGPVKILADGSLGARTAKLKKPYVDDASAQGILIHSEEEIDTLIDIAFKNDLDVAIHGIGDYTIQMAIDKINHHQSRYKRLKHRNSIVHSQIMDQPLIDLMAQSYVHALVQPVFLEYDMTIVEKRVGAELAQTSYAYKTMQEAGIILGFGSDAPVEDPNPFRSIYYAVYRQRPDGTSYYPEEGISVTSALECFTSKAAFFSYEEHIKGKLEPGYYADFIVLSKPIETATPEELLNMKIKATYLGGQCVHQAITG